MMTHICSFSKVFLGNKVSAITIYVCVCVCARACVYVLFPEQWPVYCHSVAYYLSVFVCL